MQLYQKIKKLCKERDVSVYCVEQDLEFSTGSVSKWDVSIPSADKLQRLAKYFDVPIEYFLEGEE